MADITLHEYLGSAQRGLLSKIFGPEFILKQTYLQASDIFTETFGRRVWDAMNNRTVFYNAVRKVGWGPTFGWRLRTDRGTGNSYAVTETGTLPTIDVSNYVNVGSPPKFPATTFGVSIRSQFMGGLEGGIGDALAVEQEAKMRDHVKIVNQGLTKGNYGRVDARATTSYTLASPAYPVGATCTERITLSTAADVRRFNIGDELGICDSSTGSLYEVDSGGDSIYVVGVDETNGYVYYNANFVTRTPTAGDILYVTSRVTGVTSITDICAEDGMKVAGGGHPNIAPNVFNLTTRTAGGYAAAAVVNDNAGVARDLTLKALDDCIDAVRERGGMMGLGLITTGYGQYSALDRLLQAQQRYLGYGKFQFGVGDERTYPGTESGMELASYRGIPILPDPDIPKSMTEPGVPIGHDIYVLDLDHLEIGVGITTQYFENRNYFVANALVVQGLLFTALELRARRLDVQAVITNLNA